MTPFRPRIVFIVLSACSCLLLCSALVLEHSYGSVNSRGSSRLLAQQFTAKSFTKSFQRRREDGNGNAVVSYRWLDPHSIRYVQWIGDATTVDAKRAKYFTIEATINLDRLNQAIESFGFPEAWGRRTVCYTTQAELKRKEAEFIRSVAARGIKLTEGKVDGGKVDWEWIVENSKADMNPLVKSLRGLAQQNGYRNQRQLIAVLASFAQSMEYSIPAETRITKNYGTVKTGGATMPIETLYTGRGDCDTKALLFASMIANIPRQKIIFLFGNVHLFVGIRGVPRRGDHFVNSQGAKYILIEMTTPWPVGHVSQELWRGCQRNLFQMVRIVDTGSLPY